MPWLVPPSKGKKAKKSKTKRFQDLGLSKKAAKKAAKTARKNGRKTW